MLLQSKRGRIIAVASLLPLSGLCYWLLRRKLKNRRGLASAEEVKSSGRGSSLPTTAVAKEAEDDEADDDNRMDEGERASYHAVLAELKARGNEFFRAGKYEMALETYQNCIDACLALGLGDAVAVEVHQVVRVNVILVFLKLKRPEEARMVATFLLQDETSPLEGELKVKALYRRGLASQEIGDVESAICDFRAAVEYSPGRKNPPAERALEVLTRNGG